MSDSDDDWLEKHKPTGFCGALEAGRRAIEHRGGNVWLALHDDRELRVEIALAWVDEAKDIEVVRDRIRLLAGFIDAEDDVWFGFGN